MSDGDEIVLALRFTESVCSGCGSVGAAGDCPECGGRRPDNSDTDPILTMRRRALTGMGERIGVAPLQWTGERYLIAASS